MDVLIRDDIALLTCYIKATKAELDSVADQIYENKKGYTKFQGVEGTPSKQDFYDKLGEDYFLKEAVEFLYQDIYFKQIEAADVKVYGKPNLLDWDKDGNISFQIGIEPQIEVGRYKGISRKLFDSEDQYDFEEDVLDYIISKSVFNVVPFIIPRKKAELMKDFEINLNTTQNLSLDEYLKEAEMTMDELELTFESKAENEVKARLVLLGVATEEDLSVSNAEIDDTYVALSKQYNIDVAKIRDLWSKEDLKEELLKSKALTLILDNMIG